MDEKKEVTNIVSLRLPTEGRKQQINKHVIPYRLMYLKSLTVFFPVQQRLEFIMHRT